MFLIPPPPTNLSFPAVLIRNATEVDFSRSSFPSPKNQVFDDWRSGDESGSDEEMTPAQSPEPVTALHVADTWPENEDDEVGQSPEQSPEPALHVADTWPDNEDDEMEPEPAPAFHVADIWPENEDEPTDGHFGTLPVLEHPESYDFSTFVAGFYAAQSEEDGIF
jgi:hypothetical protein